MKKGVKMTDEQKKNMFGHKPSEETKAKLSAIFKGVPKNFSDEHRAYLSKRASENKIGLGYKHTDEAKAAIAASRVGKKHTDETKAIIGAKNKKHQLAIAKVKNSG
jgi:hypothetical protein